MSDSNNIDYSNWGPGAKRRRQAENARRRTAEIDTPKSRPDPRPPRKIVRERLPFEERDNVSVSMVKKMIRRLALRHKSPREIAQEMEREGIRVTLVTISSLCRKARAQEKERRSKGQA